MTVFNCVQSVDLLTGREIEILSFVRAGFTNKEIASSAFIAENTVKWHLKNIYEKLGVKRRTQAVARSCQLGIL